MLRGIFLGGVSGLAIVAAVGAVLSLTSPIFGPGPEAGSAAQEPERAEAIAGDMPTLPAPSDTPDRPDMTRPERPESDTLELAAEALQSVDTPELSAPVSDLPGAEAEATRPTEEIAETAPVAPVYPSPQSVTPDAPQTEGLAEVDTTTPVPPRAEPGEEVSGFSPSDLEDLAVVSPSVVGVTEDAPGAAPEVDPEVVPEDAAEAVAEVTSELAAAAEPAETEEERPDTGDAVPNAQASDPGTGPAEAEQPAAPTVGIVGLLPPETPHSDPEPSDDAPTATTPEITTGMPGTPGTSLIAPQPEPAEAPEPAETPAATAEDLRPIDAFAVAFDNPEAKPILSFVMIDDGTASTPLPANFPYPLSIAVPVTRDDAAKAMRDYRADGYEVLALANVPPGATPTDLENAAQGWLSTMNEVVAVMETPDLGLQSDRAMGEQLAAILSETGHGLLLYPDGLDTTRKLASRRDVPAATVFRDLDAEGQSSAVIRRFLDNSAFKAGVEGTVILVTRLRPETVEALLVWGLADRASRVALAPVSAALKASAP